MSKMKVLNLTHNDLDGVGSAVIVNKVFENVATIERFFCVYGPGLDEPINNAVKNINNYNVIILTDLSLTDDHVKKLRKAAEVSNTSVIIIDHHASSYDSYKDGNSKNLEIRYNDEFCGAKGTYLWALDQKAPVEEYERFIELVNIRDLWICNNKQLKRKADRLNQLMSIIGIQKTIDRFTENPSLKYSENEQELMRYDDKIIRKSITSAYRTARFKYEPETMKFGKKRGFLVVISDRNINEIGEAMLHEVLNYTIGKNTNFTDYLHESIGSNLAYVEYIMILNLGLNVVSFRSNADVSDVDLSEIAKAYGGGGHPYASSCSLNEFLGRNIDFVTEVLGF